MSKPAVEAAPARKGRYHHGDLRSALIGAAVELIGERGVRGFTLAEASRRVGVAGSAPYRHFADRDALLAAVGVVAAKRLVERLDKAAAGREAPARTLASLVVAYIDFAAEDRPLFEALITATSRKERYPDLVEAADPIALAFVSPARSLVAERAAADFALGIMALAHGHAVLFGEGAFTTRKEAVDRAVVAVRALVAGRDEF
ncbi:MAG: TetR/AcrR family transcriptional regulator [Bauldia sp.]|nr:TetR/AcrR family transcriptional regulator [Bauldia sp.]MCW5717073.1 TetR/AcrR family transcriptional regulator [Bauldia sp.]